MTFELLFVGVPFPLILIADSIQQATDEARWAGIKQEVIEWRIN